MKDILIAVAFGTVINGMVLFILVLPGSRGKILSKYNIPAGILYAIALISILASLVAPD